MNATSDFFALVIMWLHGLLLKTKQDVVLVLFSKNESHLHSLLVYMYFFCSKAKWIEHMSTQVINFFLHFERGDISFVVLIIFNRFFLYRRKKWGDLRCRRRGRWALYTHTHRIRFVSLASFSCLLTSFRIPWSGNIEGEKNKVNKTWRKQYIVPFFMV